MPFFALALTPGSRDDSQAISPRYCLPERAQVQSCLTAADIMPLFMRCNMVMLSCNVQPQGLRERPLAMNAATIVSPGRHASEEVTFAYRFCDGEDCDCGLAIDTENTL